MYYYRHFFRATYTNDQMTSDQHYTKFNLDNREGRGIARKMWRKCLDDDMKSVGTNDGMVHDCCAWRNVIRVPTSANMMFHSCYVCDVRVMDINKN